MNVTRQRILFAVIAICMSFSCGAFADDRTADEVLEAYKSVKNPVYDKEKKDDKEFMDKYREDYRAANKMRAELTGELFKVAPDHERLIRLMPTRWSILQGDPEHATVIAEEMAKILADSPDSKLAIEVYYTNATKAVSENTRGDEKDYKAALEAIDMFINKYPNERRGSSMLQGLARAHEFGSEEQLALYKRIIKDYPDNSKYIGGKIKQASSIGKPFKVKFQDAITGTKIDMEELKGQVVVFDFWATWCGPCIIEIPHLIELRKNFTTDELAILAISDENPGTVKRFAENKKINYTVGTPKGRLPRPFAEVRSIPSAFYIDKQGKIKLGTEGFVSMEESTAIIKATR